MKREVRIRIRYCYFIAFLLRNMQSSIDATNNRGIVISHTLLYLESKAKFLMKDALHIFCESNSV